MKEKRNEMRESSISTEMRRERREERKCNVNERKCHLSICRAIQWLLKLSEEERNSINENIEVEENSYQ
jgi:hypothetical protein